MSLIGTAILYVVLGLAVAAATVLGEDRPSASRVAFVLIFATLFWPLFAPLLFGPGRRARAAEARGSGDIERRISGAEAQLLSALATVNGGALAPEIARVHDLSGALLGMATRLAEMDEGLEAPEFDEARVKAALLDLEGRARGEDDPRLSSLNTRLRNIDRLRGMRARTSEELERAILKMEEVTSQMRILKFAGRPEAEAVQLIDAIAAGVEDVTEALLEVSA